jgi:hypothetical protein
MLTAMIGEALEVRRTSPTNPTQTTQIAHKSHEMLTAMASETFEVRRTVFSLCAGCTRGEPTSSRFTVALVRINTLGTHLTWLQFVVV